MLSHASPRPSTLVLVPGWNESAIDLRVLTDGRNDCAGFSRDYDCVLFADGEGSLTDRIRQFGTFLSALKARDPDAFPVAALGYSAGGVIVRGFLRAYPDRAGELGAVVQVGAPNWGLITDNVALLLNAMRVAGSVIEDLDIQSPFMRWLNDTPGHWERIGSSTEQRWALDRPPWVAPAQTTIVNVVGRLGGPTSDDDGLVDVRSATLDGAVPHRFVDEASANHLNLTGMWSAVTWLLKRWSCNDRVWPIVVDRAARVFESAANVGTTTA